MITTDSVVLLFCILLHLSCVYTGSREGVESGHCTLKHYLAGDVDYALKLKTMIDNHYNRIKSQLAATKLGLLIMKKDKSKFWYYRFSREKIAKTLGSYSLSKGDAAKISQIDELFQAVIDNIDDRLRDARDIYNGFDKNADDDGEVDSKFTTFCVEINPYKYNQLLTRLNTGSYVLHPSDLLEQYTSIIDPTITIPNLDEVIDAAFIKDGITIQQGGGYDDNGYFYEDAEIYYFENDIKNEKNVDKLGANENGFRKKAVFVKRPSDPYDERMEALYKIRPHRLITDQDMENIWSDWNITL